MLVCMCVCTHTCVHTHMQNAVILCIKIFSLEATDSSAFPMFPLFSYSYTKCPHHTLTCVLIVTGTLWDTTSLNQLKILHDHCLTRY